MADPTVPVLVAPIGGEQTTEKQATFFFTAPSDSDNDLLHFMLEIDSVNPPTDGNADYKKFETRFSSDHEEGRWEFWNGTVWQLLPETGLPTAYYGTTVKCTIPKSAELTLGTWYWRIQASDYNTSAVLYNQATFNVDVFGVS